MLRVGLTGGIGAGKTTVGRRFAELGALVTDADALAREAVAPGTAALERIFRRWPQVRAGDGTLDRAALAAIAFSDTNSRDALNDIVHPEVRRLLTERDRAAPPDAIVVHEIPLLFESGLESNYDATVLVVADPESRADRVVARSQLPRDDVARRIAAQIPPEHVRGRATFTIENTGSPEDVRGAADAVWQKLIALRGRAGTIADRESGRVT